MVSVVFYHRININGFYCLLANTYLLCLPTCPSWIWNSYRKQPHMNHLETDLLVIGGGATGTGIAWDAALRGFSVVLVEKRDLTHGTTGRYHGLLHSGGRYVVKDPPRARG